MKKTYYVENEIRNTIYLDVPGLWGGYIICTEGAPVTETDVEDDESAEGTLREWVNSIFDDANGREVEPLTADDIEIVNEYLEMWGIDTVK